MPLRFEWDEQKAASNLEEHRVSFREAATIFGDALSERGDHIRIISARLPTRREQRQYEEAT